MNYEEFKERILSMVREEVGENAEVMLKQVRKNNGMILDGLTIMPEGKCIAPTIYINQYYDQMKQGLPLNAIVRIILEANQRFSVDVQFDVEEFLEYDNLKDRIRFRLVNYRMNEGFLSDVPHKKYLDLAKIYYYEVRDLHLPGAFCTITESDLERWDITVEELDKVASQNTEKYEPLRIFTIREMLEILSEGKKSAGDIPEPIMPMYILTNESRFFGASCILYEHAFDRISEAFESDLFVLPSSVHEVIVTPAYGNEDCGGLGTLVSEINDECVPAQEVLSNQVYYYSRTKNRLSLLPA